MSTGVSWIKKIGLGIVKGFEWLASPSGQKAVAAGETAVELAFPPAAPVIDLVNVWMQKATVIEGKAAAAASLGVTASSTQKAAAAIEAVTPDVEGILKQYNLLPLSSDSMTKINDAVLTIANELMPGPTPPTPPVAG